MVLRIKILMLWLCLCGTARAAVVCVSGTGTYPSTIDASINNLYYEYTYASNWPTPMPIVFLQHGYGGGGASITVTARTAMATNGWFVVTMGLRGRDGASGTDDGSGREIYDIIDGYNYIFANFASSLLTNNNSTFVGYSGGGGNGNNLMCKSPDLFNQFVIYFGISDYGYSPTNYTDIWYPNGNGSLPGTNIWGEGWWYQSLGAEQSTLNPTIGNLAGGLSVTNAYRSRYALEGAPVNLQGGHVYDFHNTKDQTVPYHQSITMTNAFNNAGNVRMSAFFDAVLYPHNLPNAGSTVPYLPDGFTTWSNTVVNPYAQWAVGPSGTYKIMGFFSPRGKPFEIWLDQGISGVADLTYSGSSYTVSPLTGSMTVKVTRGNQSLTNTISAPYTFVFGPRATLINATIGGGTP